VDRGRSLLADACVTGAITALVTFAVPALSRRARGESVAAPVNAESHVLWGDEAAAQDGVSLRYTGVGAATHVGACLWWGGIYEAAMGDPMRSDDAADWRGAAATALGAYVLDYHLLPRRLTPGFEKRYSAGDMIAFFATLVAVLPLRRALVRRMRKREVEPPREAAPAERRHDPPHKRPTPHVFADRLPFGIA